MPIKEETHDVLADGTYYSENDCIASISDDLRMLTINTGWWGDYNYGMLVGEAIYPKKDYQIPISSNCDVAYNAGGWLAHTTLSSMVDSINSYYTGGHNAPPLSIVVENGEIVGFILNA